KFPDNFFQIITCLNSFHHYENPKISLKEIQ
ncbi:MAG: methyltransferase domain-containing protein, partial [Cetobacterium sp.]